MKRLRLEWVAVVLLVGCLALFPTTARASLEAVHLGYFDSVTGELTGEIYGSAPLLTPFQYFYCIEKDRTVSVPGDYFGQLLTLSSTAQQEAAWIMDKYAFSKNGQYDSLGKVGTEVAVQIAIWTVTNQAPAYNAIYASLFTAANAFINDALLNQSQWALIAANYRILDLYDKYGNQVQDQLVAVPIPSAVWLLGSGVIGLLAFRKRFSA